MYGKTERQMAMVLASVRSGRSKSVAMYSPTPEHSEAMCWRYFRELGEVREYTKRSITTHEGATLTFICLPETPPPVAGPG